MIRAIIFDFHGVLAFKKEGYKVSELAEEIDRQIGLVTNDEVFKRETMKRYRLSEKEFNSLLFEITERYEKFGELWEILPKLRKKYKLAIINNGTYLTIPMFKKNFPIDENFDLFVSSAKEGVGKPNDRIFQLTAKRLDSKPEECLFMDDSLENVQGAQKAEMKAIHWKNRNEGLDEFKKALAVEKSLF